VGPERILLTDEAPDSRPLYVGRPDAIDISELTFLGLEDRYLGLMIRDGSRYRFAFDDAETARRAEQSIAARISAAGGSFTVR